LEIKRIRKNVKSGLTLQLTGMAQRQNPLPITSGALTYLLPENFKAKGSFSQIVGGLQ